MKYSILDLVNLKAGQTYAEAYDDFIDMVGTAERLGFSRYWVAEHHNSKTIASSATQLLVLHALANSASIRVGTGGVMLPNHSPYLVAEQYGTIERLYPGRLDLGLGRAPGTDLKTARVLRRTDNLYTDFERELAELDSYFAGTADVHAYPAEGRASLTTSWDRAPTAPTSPHGSGPPTRSPRISRPPRWRRPCASTGAASSRPGSCASPTSSSV